MKPGVIYYVAERNGQPTHPTIDMFFCTEDFKLVVIQITGEGDKIAGEKMKHLTSWIEQEKDKIKRFTLHGAPLATVESRVN